MAANLLLAAILNLLTFLIHAMGLVALTRLMDFLVARPVLENRSWAKVVALLALASGLMILLCVEMALWAAGLVGVGAFADFDTAFYFSTSAFATIGFGDVAPAEKWRLLASLEGVTGFLIIGWSAAYMVTSGIRFGPFQRDMHF
ncbi:ion channel [Allomesorhizobium camelthorni]|uniref:Two pore domain potassium channel family protein n=1 Tax=Allomesorhizobium camelthorni TaxID=475069 RepID=A0A6G4WF51_9HYPH|nr:ion channel [Mesorhizobium camelthorni]NGO53214.1 two pore domain potassium channel family protein [Mesorhizobium camelthorni]